MNFIKIIKKVAEGDNGHLMTNVTVTATGGSYNYDVMNTSASSPIMTVATITTSVGTVSWGVYNNSSSSPKMTAVTITASGGIAQNYGVVNAQSSPIIKTSSISAANYSIFNSSSTAKVGATMLEGAVSGSRFTCVGAYDENFAALDTSCQ